MKNENETYDFLSKSKDFIYKLTVSFPMKVKITTRTFNTSKLLQTCSNQLHCSPKEQCLRVKYYIRKVILHICVLKIRNTVMI